MILTSAIAMMPVFKGGCSFAETIARGQEQQTGRAPGLLVSDGRDLLTPPDASAITGIVLIRDSFSLHFEK